MIVVVVFGEVSGSLAVITGVIFRGFLVHIQRLLGICGFRIGSHELASHNFYLGGGTDVAPTNSTSSVTSTDSSE